MFVFKEKKRGGYFKTSRRICLNLAREKMSKKMSKMSKEKKDSLQITRYLIDRMWDGKEVGWLSMLDDVGDREVSEYGMSMDMLNRMREWDNRVNLINCKLVDGKMVWNDTHRIIISSV